MLQFSWLEGFCQGNFLGSEHLTSSSTKTAQMINFKLNTHVSNRLLHKIMPLFFLIKSHLFIFYCNNLKSFESIFRMKTVKSRFFKKYLKRRKSRARFCFSLGWLHISKKKIVENCNSVGAGAHKVGKVGSFWPNFDPNFTDIWRMYKW